jgi:uncharacterized protein YxjI
MFYLNIIQDKFNFHNNERKIHEVQRKSHEINTHSSLLIKEEKYTIMFFTNFMAIYL